MANSTILASATIALKRDLEQVLSRFPADLTVDFWRIASSVHEEILARTDIAIIHLRQIDNVLDASPLLQVYSYALTTLLLMVNLRAFASVNQLDSSTTLSISNVNS